MKNWKQFTFVAIIAIFGTAIVFISCDKGNNYDDFEPPKSGIVTFDSNGKMKYSDSEVSYALKDIKNFDIISIIFIVIEIVIFIILTKLFSQYKTFKGRIVDDNFNYSETVHQPDGMGYTTSPVYKYKYSDKSRDFTLFIFLFILPVIYGTLFVYCCIFNKVKYRLITYLTLVAAGLLLLLGIRFILVILLDDILYFPLLRLREKLRKMRQRKWRQ